MKPGTTISAASTTTTSKAVNVPLGAAAAENVRLSGSTYGHCASPQPMMTVATAMMASARAPREALRTTPPRPAPIVVKFTESPGRGEDRS